MKKRGKRGLFIKAKKGDEILLENVIFLILNLAFFSFVIWFLLRQGSGAIILEQSYAKNIVLLIDSAKPTTEITLNMEDAFDLAEENGIDRKDIVKITGNLVSVKLSKNGGYAYSFFNEADVTAYPDVYSEKNYIIKINSYLK